MQFIIEDDDAAAALQWQREETDPIVSMCFNRVQLARGNLWPMIRKMAVIYKCFINSEPGAEWEKGKKCPFCEARNDGNRDVEIDQKGWMSLSFDGRRYCQ